ncbi:winged helix DNA-binding domain-containing protein [Dactylosporangium sp. NBC_01737]|uniref:winged helix DNA-binding domain-containing protein n=1 Tax=Dactylosporangium sp. NBC_01737 TaxID=2975959 RepID=UPI002E14696D|nr:winged helix DNA-binding domain-containing protein [Dactylosporangium sp. NBC_01737]
MLLDRRALNRATLARQLLLDRATMTVPEAVEHLAGLQAQTPHTWYTGLWTRLAGFAPAHASDLLADGRLVRVASLRSTIHLMTGRDALAVRPLVAVAGERMWSTNFRRRLGADPPLDDIVAEGRRLLTGTPMTFGELGAALGTCFPGRDPAALAQTVRVFETLVQVPPRGLWGRSGKAAHTPASAWLPHVTAAPMSVDDLVRRYLGAFGPATVRDAQVWSGLTRLAEVFARLTTVTFAGQDGRELFDLPDAPRPDPDTPAPVRYLYDFDNLLLSHADRSRVLTTGYLSQPFGDNGPMPAVVLVDGFTAALWRPVLTRGSAVLYVAPLTDLSSADLDEVAEEGARLLRFLAPPSAQQDVRFVDGGWPALLRAAA